MSEASEPGQTEPRALDTAAPAGTTAAAGQGNGGAGVLRHLKPSGRVHLPASADPGTASGGQATVEDPVFSCRDVRVFYDAKEALKGVTIDVGRRQVLAMIGPSGCGKSTFLRC